MRLKKRIRSTEEMHPIRIGPHQLDVLLRRTNRARSLRVMVDAQGVSVTAPLWLARKQMISYLQTESEWVLKQLEKMQRVESEKTEYRASMRGYVYFEGQKLRVAWVLRPDRKRPRFEVRDGTLWIEGPICDASLVEAWVRWFKRLAARRFTERVEILSESMRLYPERVSVRDQKSKWGACINRKALSFNARLIQAPPEVLDYVVIHELAHIRYMTHGARFWSLVQRFCPDYKCHRQWLRTQGWMLQWPTVESLPNQSEAAERIQYL